MTGNAIAFVLCDMWHVTTSHSCYTATEGDGFANLPKTFPTALGQLPRRGKCLTGIGASWYSPARFFLIAVQVARIEHQTTCRVGFFAR